MIRRYVKKPIPIEACQWTGDNLEEIKAFCGDEIIVDHQHHYITVKTLEGLLNAFDGDYIIKGVRGEFYPCKPDIFEETYQEVIE